MNRKDRIIVSLGKFKKVESPENSVKKYLDAYKKIKAKKEKEVAIKLRNLVIDYGETKAVDDISWEVNKGELVTLLGPSGCGKTTTLNAIAGIITPTSGRISFFGKNVTSLSSRERNLGLVFQNYALYPHMSVYKNIAFPLINDKNWKRKVIYKNNLAKLNIDIVKLKHAGASSDVTNDLINAFKNIKHVEEGYEDVLNKLTIKTSSKVNEVVAEASLLPQRHKANISKLSEKVIADLDKNTAEYKSKKISSDVYRDNKVKIKQFYKSESARYKSEFNQAVKNNRILFKEMSAQIKDSSEKQEYLNILREKIAIDKYVKKVFSDKYKDAKNNYKISSISNSDLSDKELAKISKFQEGIVKIKEAIHKEVMEVSEKVGIIKNLKKKPTKLSGGQQQRVAIARAIARKPKVLLMDEPLSNLDAKLRVSTRAWIKNIQKELGITTVFVTHDQEEAMSISDKVILMNVGDVQQMGTPMELYEKPTNLFVAKFLGMPEMTTINETTSSTGSIKYQSKIIAKSKFKNHKIVFGVRPEKIVESKTGISGEIVSLDVLGKETLATVKVGKDLIKMVVAPSSRKNIGDIIKFTFKKKSIYVFDRETTDLLEVI